jgi:hypothetical protein
MKGNKGIGWKEEEGWGGLMTGEREVKQRANLMPCRSKSIIIKVTPFVRSSN